MTPFLRLTMEDLTVVLSDYRFTPQADYRITPSIDSGGETINGAPIIFGTAVRAKHIWTLPYWATRDQFSQIQALWEIWDYKRRNPDTLVLANNHLIVDDGHEEIREYNATNSRALAINPDNSTTAAPSSISSNTIQYFARFYARFTAQPTRTLTRGPLILTTLSLRETDFFPA